MVEGLAAKQGERAGVPADTLFGPGLALARRAVSRLSTVLTTVGPTAASMGGGSASAPATGADGKRGFSSSASGGAGEEAHSSGHAAHAEGAARAHSGPIPMVYAGPPGHSEEDQQQHSSNGAAVKQAAGKQAVVA